MTNSLCSSLYLVRPFSSRARYPSDVPRVPNGVRLTEHPNHIKRRELAATLKEWTKIVQKYAKENPFGPLYFGPTSVIGIFLIS